MPCEGCKDKEIKHIPNKPMKPIKPINIEALKSKLGIKLKFTKVN